MTVPGEQPFRAVIIQGYYRVYRISKSIYTGKYCVYQKTGLYGHYMYLDGMDEYDTETDAIRVVCDMIDHEWKHADGDRLRGNGD